MANVSWAEANCEGERWKKKKNPNYWVHLNGKLYQTPNHHTITNRHLLVACQRGRAAQSLSFLLTKHRNWPGRRPSFLPFIFCTSALKDAKWERAREGRNGYPKKPFDAFSLWGGGVGHWILNTRNEELFGCRGVTLPSLVLFFFEGVLQVNSWVVVVCVSLTAVDFWLLICCASTLPWFWVFWQVQDFFFFYFYFLTDSYPWLLPNPDALNVCFNLPLFPPSPLCFSWERIHSSVEELPENSCTLPQWRQK